MEKKRNKKRHSGGVLIEYKGLGTISMDELIQAVITDINVLKDNYNAKFVTDVRLLLPFTNEYGERIDLKRMSGEKISKIDTNHYRPSCLDYER